MDYSILFSVLTRAVAGILLTQGKTDQAALLNDAAAAVGAGKNVDDIMRRYAQDWDANGEPSFESIAQTRQSIQERMGE